jgi:hypothetical protein
MREHIESAVAELDRAALIDPQRIGIFGVEPGGVPHGLRAHASGSSICCDHAD